MRTYVCDWCRKQKGYEADWILGFAAERISRSGVQREITIDPAWSERRAEHPLAVHFCSEGHKDQYIAALFRNTRGNAASPRRRTKPGAQRKGTRGRKHASETSTALGAVSIKTSSRTEPLTTEVQTAKRGTKNKKKKSKAVQLTDADEIRSHGLSVRLEDSSVSGQEMFSDGDCWSGS